MKRTAVFFALILSLMVWGVWAQTPQKQILLSYGSSATPTPTPSFALVSNVGSANQDTHTSGAINTTGATLLVMVVSTYDPNGGPTISDSKSNTWTARTAYTDGASYCRVRIYYVASPTVGTGHTFTATGGNKYSSVFVAAFSGAHATPYDVENGAAGASSTTLQTGSVTPSQDNSLIIAGVSGRNSGSTTFSINSGFTITNQDDDNGGTNLSGAMAYLIQTSATAVNPTWTASGSQTSWEANIAVFKPQ